MNLKIGNRAIHERSPVYIIAELSANHNQDLDVALQSIDAIKDTGADAVKLQTYTPGTMTMDLDSELFMTRKDSLWAGRKLYELYEEAATPWEWHPKLQAHAHSLGLDFFSSPFDTTAVDFLESLNVPAYKIASLEIVDIPLIRYIAALNKPMIISTGIASIEDIELAVATCREAGNDQLILLKCTSAYPTPLSEVDLNTIPFIAQKWNTAVGLSDHTMSISTPVAAVALGARVVEKHFIIDRSQGGPDAAFSLNQQEFTDMIRAVRDTEAVLGSKEYTVTGKMQKAKASVRSLYITKDLKKGDLLNEDNLKSLRPGHGLPPKHYFDLLGRRVNQDVPRGTPVGWNLVD